MAFVDVEAVPIEGRLWGVKVCWRVGDPVQVFELSAARKRADEAERAEDRELCEALRKAIAEAQSHMSG